MSVPTALNRGRESVRLKRVSLAAIALIICSFFLSCSTATSLGSKERKFVTGDGVKLVGQVFANSNKDAPVVLLLHMVARDQTDYRSLVPALLDNGFSVVTLDFRGHGKSTEREEGPRISFRSFGQSEWSRFPEDVNTVITELKHKHHLSMSKLAIIGASIGPDWTIRESNRSKQ
jgi:alpha-beta hydrolase superfamily lysophospholipase